MNIIKNNLFKQFILMAGFIFLLFGKNQAQLSIDSLTKLLVMPKKGHDILFQNKIVSYGKKAVPYLINVIDTDSTGSVGYHDPSSSELYLFNINYIGLRAAYLIEIILSGKKIATLFPYDVGEIYQYGVIVKVQKGNPIMKSLEIEDMIEIKKIYKKWWETNKLNSLKKLRENWRNKKRVLKGTSYTWK
jgi:hypothetical protein